MSCTMSEGGCRKWRRRNNAILIAADTHLAADTRLVVDAQRSKRVHAPCKGGGDSTNEEEDSRHRGGHGIGKELDLTGPARRGSGDPSRHIRTSREEGRSPVGVGVGQRRDWRGIGGATGIEWISNQGGKGRLRPWLWSPTVLKW